MLLAVALVVLQIPGSGLNRHVAQQAVDVTEKQREVTTVITSHTPPTLPDAASVPPQSETMAMLNSELLTPNFTAAMVIPAPPVYKPRTTVPNRRLWVTLAIAQHSAAGFDAWTTRHRIGQGGYRETNPLLRPFASNSSIYVAIQALPFAMDFTGRKMQTSNNKFLRRFWWLPQTAQAATSVVFGISNLRK